MKIQGMLDRTKTLTWPTQLKLRGLESSSESNLSSKVSDVIAVRTPSGIKSLLCTFEVSRLKPDIRDATKPQPRKLLFTKP